MPDPKDSLFTGRTEASTFDRVSSLISRATGSPWAVMVAIGVVAAWALTGPIFEFSDTWQLMINTSTTIVTFLMVFVIQHSQNKDTIAIQLKLNELIASTKGASNRLIDVEDLSDRDLEHIKAFYVRLAARARDEVDIGKSHSLAEAETKAKPSLEVEGR